MNILILGDLGATAERLGRQHEVVCWSDPSQFPPELLHSETALIIARSPHKITSELIAVGERLRWIIRAGSGTDNIAVETAAARGIQVFTTPSDGAAVAELAFALLLSVIRQITWLDASLRRGEWRKSEAQGIELRGKTLLLVGFGRIGRKIARIAEAFGMQLIICDRSPQKPEKQQALRELPSARVMSPEEALPLADILVLSCPLTSETHHFINADRLDSLRHGAVLINVARGGVVDEVALAKALDDGRVSGAGIDTFEVEPPMESPLLRYRQVVVTPHVGAQTREAREHIGIEVEKLIFSEVGCGCRGQETLAVR